MKRKQRYYTITDMYKLAAKHGGKCTATTFKTGEEKLGWVCARGHEQAAVPKSIIKGRWCPICGRERGSQGRKTPLHDIEAIIERNNWTLLSSSAEYRNRHSQLRLKCRNCGAEWQTATRNIPTTKCPGCQHSELSHRNASSCLITTVMICVCGFKSNPLLPLEMARCIDVWRASFCD